MDPEETGYSMAFIMDAWTFPCSEEARAQSVDIPVRGCGGGGGGVGRTAHAMPVVGAFSCVRGVLYSNGGGGCGFIGSYNNTRLLSFDSLRSYAYMKVRRLLAFLIRSLPFGRVRSSFVIDRDSPFFSPHGRHLSSSQPTTLCVINGAFRLSMVNPTALLLLQFP